MENSMEGNNEYYFTFGADSPLADFVQQVSAPDEEAARRGVHRFYASRWAFCYRAEDVSPAVAGGRVVLPSGTVLERLPRKIVVDGGGIYTEKEAGA